MAAGTDLAPTLGLGWPAGRSLDARDRVDDEQEHEGEGERFARRHEGDGAASASGEGSADSVARHPASATLDLVLAFVVALALLLVLDQPRGGPVAASDAMALRPGPGLRSAGPDAAHPLSPP